MWKGWVVRKPELDRRSALDCETRQKMGALQAPLPGWLLILG